MQMPMASMVMTMLGAPFIMFNNVFANVIRADGAARESMIANCAGTI